MTPVIVGGEVGAFYQVQQGDGLNMSCLFEYKNVFFNVI